MEGPQKKQKSPRRKAASADGGDKRLSANMEDYLEAIYRISEKEGFSRVSSIAEAVGVKRPSVSKALKRLQREGLVTHTRYGGATVTQRGRQVAQAQIRSHRAITRFLQEVMALNSELAEHDACLMEHAISHETVERLVAFIDFLEKHGRKVTKEFRESLPQSDDAPETDLPSRKTGAGRSWTSRV